MAENSHQVGALSPEMALLGLLYAGPSHGYDLHKKVSAELSHVWHLSQSQAYAILKRLEKQGFITTHATPQDHSPTRQSLELSEAGKRHFISWMDSPSSGSIRSIRLEFITRVYFAQAYFPEKLPALFKNQRERVAYHIARLEQLKDLENETTLYDRMSLSLRVYHLQNVLDWLDDFEPEILGDPQ